MKTLPSSALCGLGEAQSLKQKKDAPVFDDAKGNPSLVAYIMDKINEQVVGKALY